MIYWLFWETRQTSRPEHSHHDAFPSELLLFPFQFHSLFTRCCKQLAAWLRYLQHIPYHWCLLQVIHVGVLFTDMGQNILIGILDPKQVPPADPSLYGAQMNLANTGISSRDHTLKRGAHDSGNDMLSRAASYRQTLQSQKEFIAASHHRPWLVAYASSVLQICLPGSSGMTERYPLQNSAWSVIFEGGRDTLAEQATNMKHRNDLSTYNSCRIWARTWTESSTPRHSCSWKLVSSS